MIWLPDNQMTNQIVPSIFDYITLDMRSPSVRAWRCSMRTMMWLEQTSVTWKHHKSPILFTAWLFHIFYCNLSILIIQIRSYTLVRYWLFPALKQLWWMFESNLWTIRFYTSLYCIQMFKLFSFSDKNQRCQFLTI